MIFFVLFVSLKICSFDLKVYEDGLDWDCILSFFVTKKNVKNNKVKALNYHLCAKKTPLNILLFKLTKKEIYKLFKYKLQLCTFFIGYITNLENVVKFIYRQ